MTDPTGAAGAPEERLVRLREVMSEVTDRLIELMGERRNLAIEIGRVKKELGLPVLDPAREARMVRQAAVRARELGVDPEMARDIIWRIIASARAAQGGRRPGWPDPPRDPAR
ncbi:MAG: chorismate mutase [Gammaproteobacteria bacterium]|nr:chorismate mutase [Gammaproteobacteria bacterium]MDE0650038.1 chorismate mutase [Gammaproteobacteria bacterium]MXW10420.1 chorismate mutase [Gammaproteobacteria bacterium]MYC51125.1 chorismate mutase [Gammaproteobacteria bacterium]